MFDLARRFALPVITFIDTQGAEPGVGAEERGQSEAIAANLELMAKIEAPVIACVIGEGGSGGALALGVGNAVLMQENACYSVITPGGLRGDSMARGRPAEGRRSGARAAACPPQDLLHLGVIDEIVPEPRRRGASGAGRRRSRRSAMRSSAISSGWRGCPPEALREDRARKFAAMGTAYHHAHPR